jgi:hypothetical protein
MLCDDRSVGLLRHDKPKKVFTHLIVGVRLQPSSKVLGSGRANGVAYRIGLGTLNGHAGEQRQVKAQFWIYQPSRFPRASIA